MGDGIDHRDALDDAARFASAISNADELRQTPRAGDVARCLLCQREVGLAIVVVPKATAVGRSEALALPVVGVCADCRAAASDDRRAAVADLVQAATRADALLALIRHRADGALSGWWGGVGACTQADVDAASVALRRATERIGQR